MKLWIELLTQSAAALFASADSQVSDRFLHREALPVDGITICPLMAACDSTKLAAHRNHALRSGPGGKRLRIARRAVTSATRMIAASSSITRSMKAMALAVSCPYRGAIIEKIAMAHQKQLHC